MNAPAIIIGEQCRYCRKWFPKGDFVRFGPARNMARCLKCHENHLLALDVLGDKAQPMECAFCHVPWATLCERHPGEQVPMAIHSVDGTYLMACKACDERIVILTAHLYKGTPLAAERKL